MRVIGKSSEDDMILEYLKSEVGNNCIELNPFERKLLLCERRKYGKNEGLFYNFPKNIEWFKATFTLEDLKKVMYIKYQVWNVYSNNTRLAIDGIANIKNDIIIEGICTEKIKSIAKVIESGIKLDKLIFVSTNEKSHVVVLEGHHRLTAYMLNPQLIKKGLEVIIGFSPEIQKWCFY